MADHPIIKKLRKEGRVIGKPLYDGRIWRDAWGSVTLHCDTIEQAYELAKLLPPAANETTIDPIQDAVEGRR